MNAIKALAREIAKILREENGSKKTSPYDTQAVVKRIEDGIAWVSIPGGVDETPVRLTIDAKEGDVVQIRVANGRAWLTGNSTAPPTDDTRAKAAQQTAQNAEKVAIESNTISVQAAETADEAKEDAGKSITTDTLHYLATDLESGVTVNTPGWTLNIQTITTEKPYLWIYHTYHKASGQSYNTTPIIAGVYGETGATGAQGPQGPQGATGPT
jgi:hypothetical protein